MINLTKILKSLEQYFRNRGWTMNMSISDNELNILCSDFKRYSNRFTNKIVDFKDNSGDITNKKIVNYFLEHVRIALKNKKGVIYFCFVGYDNYRIKLDL